MGTTEQEQYEYITMTIDEIQSLSATIGKLKLQKERLERELISAFGHSYEGARTYSHESKTVTIKTLKSYALNKKQYDLVRAHVPSDLDPVFIKPTFSIKKEMIKEIKETRFHDWENIVSQFIKESDSKPTVTIGDMK